MFIVSAMQNNVEKLRITDNDSEIVDMTYFVYTLLK